MATGYSLLTLTCPLLVCVFLHIIGFFFLLKISLSHVQFKKKKAGVKHAADGFK